jgi:membrane-associated protein
MATARVEGGGVTAVFDALEAFSGLWWFPFVIFAVAVVDSVVPVVPSETTVIIGGVAAGLGNQPLGVVIAAGMAGAFLGDNLAYQLGFSAGPLLRRTVFRGERGRRRLDWATRQLRTRGGTLLFTARFVPGGRTATTLSSGATHQPRGRFALFVGAAAAVWATYGALLGFLGGRAFAHDHARAFLVAFGTALAATLGIEAFRHLRARGRARAVERPADDGDRSP